MKQFQKQLANIPDCCRVNIPLGNFDIDKILDTLPQKAINDSNKGAIRKKWGIIGNEGENLDRPKFLQWLKTFPGGEIQKAHISLMEPKSQLTIHRDGYGVKTERRPHFDLFNDTMRFHFPLRTNSQSLLFCNGKFFEMKVGECWMLNNFQPHSAVNSHETEDRYHLIIDVVPNQETLKLVANGEADLGMTIERLEKQLDWRRKEFRKINVGGTRGPDFFLLGAMKSGTTSLYHYLIQHPNIAPPVKKELHYYDHKQFGEWSHEDYLNNFPVKADGEISGEATAYYLRHPHTPRWIKRDFPEARFIALLRNPIDRAYSHYQQRFVKGKETRSFGEAIRGEKDYIAEDWKALIQNPQHSAHISQGCSFLARGHYAEQIKTWLRFFPRDRLHILLTDDLKSNCLGEVQRIFDFLGLSDSFSEFDANEILKTREYEPMSKEDRKWAENYFRPRNANLSQLLGRELPW